MIKALVWYVMFSINQWFGTDFGKTESEPKVETVMVESSKSGMSGKEVIPDLPVMYGDPLDLPEMPRYYPLPPSVINPSPVTNVNP